MVLTEKDLDFTVWAIMDVSPKKAYEAVVDPKQLTEHFTTGGAKGVMESGKIVTWEFADFPGAFDVKVLETQPSKSIVFEWPHPTGEGANQVTFYFESLADGKRCKVSVLESGWQPSPEGLKAAYGNCMGWSHMLASMKAWLDHGVQLRAGMFK